MTHFDPEAPLSASNFPDDIEQLDTTWHSPTPHRRPEAVVDLVVALMILVTLGAALWGYLSGEWPLWLSLAFALAAAFTTVGLLASEDADYAFDSLPIPTRDWEAEK